MESTRAARPGTDRGSVEERRQHLFGLARTTTGFMPDDEGEALFRAARRAGTSLPGATFVEIGAWCGKSTTYLGAAAEETGSVLFSLDHHHGSEENQAGWEHHDSSLVDPSTGRIDTLPHWRRAMIVADLETSVVGLVGDSPTVSSRWTTPLAFCFIDGGHGEAARVGRLPRLGAPRGDGRLAGHPRRVPGPG